MQQPNPFIISFFLKTSISNHIIQFYLKKKKISKFILFLTVNNFSFFNE